MGLPILRAKIHTIMILITGATGFLGKYIVKELLEAGYDLRILVRNASKREIPWNGLVEVVDGDVNDILSLDEAFKGVDTVIHAAAVVSFWKKRRAEMMHVNVSGTANIVNACLEFGVSNLIHISSTSATGKESKSKVITEETKWYTGKSNSKYGLSKHKAEMEIHRGVAEGLHAVMLNPGVILGAGDWEQGTPKMFSIVDRGLTFFNRGLMGVVGAEDVARAVRLLVEKEAPANSRFLLISENMEQKDLFGQIAHVLGKKAPTIKLPAFISLIAGLVSEVIAKLNGKEPIISLESMRSSIGRYKYDGSKIEDLGLEYTPISKVIAEVGKVYLKEKRD